MARVSTCGRSDRYGVDPYGGVDSGRPGMVGAERDDIGRDGRGVMFAIGAAKYVRYDDDAVRGGGTVMSGTVREAVEAAREWLAARRGEIAGYRGAFISGSAARLADGDAVPAGSDLDVMVVADEEGCLGKAFAGEIVIEGTVLAAGTALDAEAVLRDYHLAPGMTHGRIIDDPAGEIARAQAAVRERYADPETIGWRLDHVEARARATLASALEERPEAERVTAWLFGTGQLAHMVLVGGLENPTIRARYVRAGEVLGRAGEEVAYERLLRLARSNRLRRPAVEALGRELDALLEMAGPVAAGSDWRFASDIAPAMRPVVMGGIRAMIREGHHREAMFPIAMTWLRCAQVLARKGGGPAHEARLREAMHVGTEEELRAAVAESVEAVAGFRALAERIAGTT